MCYNIYEIKKGKHFSGIHLKLHLGVDKIIRKIVFDNSCIYNFKNEDQYDINKLFGLSFGHHHNNSARFGWRANEDKIEIYAYYYSKGSICYANICSVKSNVPYEYSILIENGVYIFQVENSEGYVIGSHIANKAETCGWGYYLYPYFGGNNTAPHDMIILMKEINHSKSIQSFL
jgi:hypothetical protein